MPAYNTRRKSISLTALGVHLPNASRVHRPAQKSISSIESPPQPPTKRVKRSHDDHEPISPVSTPRSNNGSPVAEEQAPRPKSRRGAAEHTPPPSPRDAVLGTKVDTEGINDDIVIAVIEQLEKTGNRPHLIKELATVLAATNDSVAQYVPREKPRPHRQANATALLSSSANPAALLSSRLSLYLKRQWTALAPCPLAKELIPVHPRKVFFFLTTQPRQPLPINSDDIITPAMVGIQRLTPSISDPSIVEDDDVEMQEQERYERSRLSPSPDVDLSSSHLDQHIPAAPPTPGEGFSGRSSLNPDGTVDSRAQSMRAPSPPLEPDEKGFTETATAVRARGMSLQQPQLATSIEEPQRMVEPMEETPEMRHRRDQELGYELFGHGHPGLQVLGQKAMASSPMLQPRQEHLRKLQVTFDFDDVDMDETRFDLMSPESIEIDDLDDMFADC